MEGKRPMYLVHSEDRARTTCTAEGHADCLSDLLVFHEDDVHRNTLHVYQIVLIEGVPLVSLVESIDHHAGSHLSSLHGHSLLRKLQQSSVSLYFFSHWQVSDTKHLISYPCADEFCCAGLFSGVPSSRMRAIKTSQAGVVKNLKLRYYGMHIWWLM